MAHTATYLVCTGSFPLLVWLTQPRILYVLEAFHSLCGPHTQVSCMYWKLPTPCVDHTAKYLVCTGSFPLLLWLTQPRILYVLEASHSLYGSHSHVSCACLIQHFVYAPRCVSFFYSPDWINAPQKHLRQMHPTAFYFSCTYTNGISMRIIIKDFHLTQSLINETALNCGFNWVFNCKPKAAI